MSIKDKTNEVIERVKEEGEVLKGERSKDKRYSSLRRFDNEILAKREFFKGKARLFHVNEWHKMPGIANATFTLYNATGEQLSRTDVQMGDFIKIDLPGPAPMYWVKVSEVSAGEDYAEFTVQPTYDPTEQDDKTVTDHFFQDKARSTFRVERHSNEIIAMEIGTDEAINNKEAEAGDKAIINTIVSTGGWALFQKYQWKNLTDYIVGMF